MKRIVPLIVATTLSMGAIAVPAWASPSHHTRALGRAKHCRIDFVKRTEHHRVVCVWHLPSAKTPGVPVSTTSTITVPASAVAPPSGIPASGTVAVTYGVKLDPSFVQNPNNAQDVTWSFSAAATVNGVTQKTVQAGVLDLYLNGTLECSDNVGGSVTGGTCEVSPTPLGNNSVVVEYSSNNTTVASESEIDTVTPFTPSLAVPNVRCIQDSDATCTVELTPYLSGLIRGLAPNGTFTLSGQGPVAINPQCNGDTYSSSQNNASSACDAEIPEVCQATSTWTPTISFGNDTNYPGTSAQGADVAIPADPYACTPPPPGT